MGKDVECFGRCWSRRKFLKAIGGATVGTLALASGIAWLSGEKSVYELGQDKVVEYQTLCRPKIEELLGAENYERCCAAMLVAYDEFAPHLPILEDRNNRDVFLRNAPFMLSLYRALIGEFALSQDAALDTLSQIASYKVREDYGNDPAMKFIMARVARSDLFRKLFVSIWERQNEAYGWATEFPESDAYIAIDVTRCGLVDWYADEGVSEIAPIGCEGDFIMAEFMTGLKLERTKTIAGDNDICDFRYVQEPL
jgi:hypothetical protein